VRAAVVLALVIAVSAPPVPWTVSPDAAPKAGATALASPVSAACALVRGSAKAEKTFAGDPFAAIDRQPRHPAGQHAIVRATPNAQPSHLDLDNPPLAPRPPPLPVPLI
jgi:hypothetical protein